MAACVKVAMRLRNLPRWNQHPCGWKDIGDSPNLLCMRTEARSDLPPTRAAVLHEPLKARLRAKELRECLESDMDVLAPFELEYWKFDWLKERSLRNMAMRITGNLEVVIISASGPSALPLEMEQWLNAWAHKPKLSCSVLIALYSKGQIDPTYHRLLHDRLQRTARQQGVDFFCEFFKSAGASIGAGPNLPTDGRYWPLAKSKQLAISRGAAGEVSAQSWNRKSKEGKSQ